MTLTLATEILLWSSLAAVVFVYFVYPATLVFVARMKKGDSHHRYTAPSDRIGSVPLSEYPNVTLVISAYNEAEVMREKIENSLALNYPPEKLEILVISDASMDGTDEIVRSYSDRGILLYRQNPRGGKSLGLTQFVPRATGAIIVFSDANSMYDPDAAHCLVRHFANPAVGFVAGHQRYVDDRSAASASESLYWRYETFLKSQESRIGSVVCGDGAIYAIRAELFEPLREDDINDFTLPLRIIARGYRGIFDPEAFCYEHAAADFSGEFRRKVRIVNRSLRAVCRVPQTLNPFRVGLFAYQLAVHKVLRWFVPFLLIVALAANVFLALSTTRPPSRQPSPPAAGGEGRGEGGRDCEFQPFSTRSCTWEAFAVRDPFAVASGVLCSRVVGICPWREETETGLRGKLFLPGEPGGALGSAGSGIRQANSDVESRAKSTGEQCGERRLVKSMVTGITSGIDMTLAWLIVFWGSAAVLFYVHVGYALVLRAISWMCKPQLAPPRPLPQPLSPRREGRGVGGEGLPTVTLIIPAYNEESVLAAKLENSLAIDYPAGHLGIVVASDGSTDETVAIAKSSESRGVRVVAHGERRGKASVINDAVATTTGDVLCLCDANVLFRSDALRLLVSHLADPAIGAVSGDVRLASHESNFGRGESLYYRVERWIQCHESNVGSMIGVDGGMYVVRRELFSPLPSDTILDDFVTSMRVIRQRKRIVYEPAAIASENGTPLASQEFRRRVRITAGAVQSFKRGEWPPLARPAELWQFLSHKLLRWTGPLWLIGLLVANCGLLHAGVTYQATLGAQLAVYGLATLTTAFVGLRNTWIGGVAFYFVMSHVAMSLGVIKGLLNLQEVSWPRTERSWSTPEVKAVVKC